MQGLDIRRTLSLALPIMAGQVGQMVIALTDTVMVGRLGTVELAAASFANSVTSIFLLFGVGLVSAVSVRASRAHGAGDREESGQILRHGLVLSSGIGAGVAAVVSLSAPLLFFLGQPAEVVQTSLPFFYWIAWSLPAAFATIALRNYAEAHSKPWVPFWILMASVALNVLLNWMLIFGNLGAPKMGLDGAGLATWIARGAGLLVLLVWVLREPLFRDHLPEKWWGGWQQTHFQDLLSVGMPVGAQIVGEAGAFSVAGLMMGWLGSVPLAAHQIALTCAATTFMFPHGLSIALTIRIGQCLGRREHGRIAGIVKGAFVMAAAIMLCFTAAYIGFGEPLARCFSIDEAVVKQAMQLLVVVGLFQFFDGMQVMAVGALRGFGDVRVVMLVAVGTYFGMSLPLGWWLGFREGMGPLGVWGALALGLVLVAALLGWRLTTRIPKSGGVCQRE